MRGIMIHSLMSRGAGFEEAFQAASAIRDELRNRETVGREELTKLIDRAFPDGLEERPRRAGPEIQVLSGRSQTPFSKGVLSQSLLAAAIEPDQAHEVAREIEATLIGRGLAAVDRTELRALSAEVLEQQLNPRVAGRYLAWREFLDEERPLILLLAGAAGVGKSSLAQAVAHRLGVAGVTSTDAIRQVMRIMLGPELVPAIHASSYDAHKLVTRSEAAEDPVIDAFRAQAATVSVGARAMIERAIEESSSMILDGVAILPGLVDPSAYSDGAYVVSLVVATLSEEAFEARFAKRARSAAGRPPHRYLGNLAAILRIQDHILELAEQYDVPIVDNSDFDSSVRSILRHVTETLRKERRAREGVA
jgi:2-phosphoglycerate kinase